MNLLPDEIVHTLFRVGYHTDEFEEFVSVIYEVLFPLNIIGSLALMTNTIYLYDDLVFDAHEVTNVVSECLLSTEIVWRSFQYHPHTYFREIHILFVLRGIRSDLFSSFEGNGGHGESIAKIVQKSPPCPSSA